MSVHDRKNLKSALESAILYLQKQGVEEARQDAWLLLEHVCGISHSTYFVHSEDEMPKEQQEQYEALVRKRGEHIPLQQLTGEQEFMGLRGDRNLDHRIVRLFGCQPLQPHARRRNGDFRCIYSRNFCDEGYPARIYVSRRGA